MLRLEKQHTYLLMRIISGEEKIHVRETERTVRTISLNKQEEVGSGFHLEGWPYMSLHSSSTIIGEKANSGYK